MQLFPTSFVILWLNFAQRTLSDTRDSNTYIVRKLADGNCWMSENLKLGSTSTTITLNSTTSDRTSGTYTLPIATTSWTWPSDAGNLTTTEATTSQVYPSGTNRFYNYYTATAGSASTSSGTASYSICPKNWTLPNRSKMSTLMSKYGLSANSSWSVSNPTTYNKWISSPLSFSVYTVGNIDPFDKQYVTNHATGIWESVSVDQTVAQASFWGYDQDNTKVYFVWVPNSDYRARGYPVRCIAR